MISAFQKIIEHFESTEMDIFFENQKRNKFQFSSSEIFIRKELPLEKLKIKNEKVFNEFEQSLILTHWRKRQLKLNRPLLRKYWKIVHLPFNGFRSQNQKKLAFAPRDEKKKKTRINNRCLRGEMMSLKLEELKYESSQLLGLVKMVTLREKLKMQHLLLQFRVPETNSKVRVKVIDRLIEDTRDLLTFLPSLEENFSLKSDIILNSFLAER